MNNYLIKHIAHLFSPLIKYSGIGRISKQIYGGYGHILMLHRVIPTENKTRIHNHQSIEITEDQLSQLIKYFIRNSYKTISLDELYNRLINNDLPRKFVVYTLDDGYFDNYQYAYPIFKKYNIPFTIYIANSFPNKKILLWWYALEDLLLKKNSFSQKEYFFLNKIKCKTAYQKELAFNLIRTELLKMNKEELIRFFDLFDIDLNSYNEKMSLTWDQIIQLSNDPMVTIGGHTQNHLALAKLSEKECYLEIINSQKEIEQKIGKKVTHFSYPYGKINQAGIREFEMVKEIGFSTATTTRLANIFPEHKNYLQALPRISINSQTSESLLKANIDGIFPMFRNNFRRIVTD
ncbi:polysaccharide deacetylase family protein [Plebeiibacterium sediminum]|uniref:Polysaccharide deacetylase family protein n=1 Tax=Plebeiibacterium sediminum TaxID=2992112 RepID=A0AAE3SEH6_9BACT|nr:polysaccharide deacetylase family protein [Plebeiobacterium sediminum]MCW3786241.1 polysaccharide deacetylase family protein [Plebeiobacterium sediminum]